MNTVRFVVAMTASVLFGGFITVVLLQHSAVAQETATAKVAAPSCATKLLSGPNWQMAVCAVGTKTCVAVAGHSGSGIHTPLSSTNVTCF